MGIISFIHSVLIKIRNTVINAVFPRFCVFCEKEGFLVCLDCQNKTPVMVKPACPVCDKKGNFSVCKDCTDKTPLMGVVSLFEYGDPAVRRLIDAWKYVGDRDASLIIKKWVELGLEKNKIDVDVVTYIPLHLNKKRARGFDQASELATYVASYFNLDSRTLLVRALYTEPQAQKDKKERVVGDWDSIFQVKESPKQNICICDDVFTTGTTMAAATKKLKKAGALEIWGFTLAKG